MSSLIVEVCNVSEIKVHNNADSLDIAIIKGWQVCVKKNTLKQNDIVIYFPPDSLIPKELSDRLGITQYLSSQGKTKSIKLRGEYSHGFVIPLSEFPELKLHDIGDNVADILGIKKWEPSVSVNINNNQVETQHPLFYKYTDIENIRNFPDIIQDDELVILTEKLHGSNSRIGLIEGNFIAGSHNQQLKRPDTEELLNQNFYWLPLTISGIKNMLNYLSTETKGKPVIIYGELLGNQDLKYGYNVGSCINMGYRAFDISIDGNYMGFNDFEMLCREFNIPYIPIIKKDIKFGDIKNNLEQLCQGDTLIENAKNIKEGIVIKLVQDRWNEKTGRTIMKYLSNTYLTRKGGTEFK